MDRVLILESRIPELGTAAGDRLDLAGLHRPEPGRIAARRLSMHLIRLITMLATLALTACEEDLLADLPDAAPDATTGCPTPLEPLAVGTYKVYLNTEGVTVTKGNGCDNSRIDCSLIVVADNTMVPPFLPGNAGRRPFIDAIVAKAQAALAPYSIDIVTVRPTTGDYEMMVLGGDGATIAGCTGCGGVSPYAGCGRGLSNRNHISFIFDFGMELMPDGSGDIEYYASNILSELGAVVDLVPTTVGDDCMCRFDAGCGNRAPGTMCTFGTNVPTTTGLEPSGAPYNCNISPQDEPAQLKKAFGCR